jgi:hypothetical protein
MAQSLNHPLGLHCLLYLVADRVCVPETAHPDGSIADALSASEHLFARIVGSAINAVMWNPPKSPDNVLVFVPCRPTLAISKSELAARLLMAALLECRDWGVVELRLAEQRSRGRRGVPAGIVQVMPLGTPALGGLCGQITKALKEKGEFDAKFLVSYMMRKTGRFGGRNYGGGWVIDQVESELASHGYMRSTVAVRRWPPGEKVWAAVDCDQIQHLAPDCALAVDRWNQAWAADVSLYDALLAACTLGIDPPDSGGGG